MNDFGEDQILPAHVLVVDDEPFNLEILSEHLTDAGYIVSTAADGVAGWEILQQQGAKFDAILLDRMMPRMDGMQLLGKIRQHPACRHVPVIMQTAVGAAESVREGLAAGAYYYLVKPFQRDTLLGIVAAAVGFHRERVGLEQQLTEQATSFRLLVNGDFRFRTLGEARQLTLLLSQACPNPQRVAVGLSELLINAVEHGNLGIGYAEKSRLLQNGAWQTEIERRLQEPTLADRWVRVAFRTDDELVTIAVKDEGSGFDWRPYLDFSTERAFDPHGRGISLARKLSFDALEYFGNGSTVLARVKR